MEIKREYQKTIEKYAYNYSQKTKIAMNEFVSEGYFAYVNCLKNFCPEKGEFKPYLCSALNNIMNKYSRIFQPKDEFIEEWAVSPKIPDQISFEDSINKLPQSAKEIINLIRDAKSELYTLSNISNKKITKNLITCYLRKKGWPFKKIKMAFEEIKEIL